jgi:hypothetical protein
VLYKQASGPDASGGGTPPPGGDHGGGDVVDAEVVDEK